MTDSDADALPMATAGTQTAAQRRMWRSKFESALIWAGLAALLLFLGHHVFSDAEVRYRELSDLLQRGQLSSSKFSLIGPLFSTPIWFIGGWLHLPHNGVGVYNWVVFTLGVGALYLLLKDHIDRGLLRTFLLLLIAASMFPYHLTNYYGEVFTAVCLAVGLVAVHVGRIALGWTLVVLGVVNTPAALVALAIVVAVRAARTRRARSVLPLVAAAVLIAAENWIRRGSPFASNYESGFGLPFFALLAILFSFGKGLIFFTPGLFLLVRRRLERLEPVRKRLLAALQVDWIVFVVGLVAVYSSWWAWGGGWFWGPRFFLFASFPASLMLAIALRHHGTHLLLDLATLLTLCLSVWVDIDGAVFGNGALFNLCVSNNYARGYLCDYVPSDSVLWHPFVAPQHLTLLNLAYIAYCAVVLIYLAAPVTRSVAATSFTWARGLVGARWQF
ncbi:MAG TPA: hypothetical protein VF808_07600 [Ktedonobacterales bacterium]